jgi:hypothetical protein
MKLIYLQNENHEVLINDLANFFGAIINFSAYKDNATVTVYQDGKACLLVPDNFDVSIFESQQFIPKSPEFSYSGFELPSITITARDQVKQDIEFGRNVVIDYLAENKTMDLSTEASLIQLQKLQGIKMLLESGAVGAARDLLTATVVDEVFTEERKTSFINKLNAYLNESTTV